MAAFLSTLARPGVDASIRYQYRTSSFHWDISLPVCGTGTGTGTTGTHSSNTRYQRHWKFTVPHSTSIYYGVRLAHVGKEGVYGGIDLINFINYKLRNEGFFF